MRIYNQLQDGKRALGFGMAFIAYAAILFIDVYRKRRNNRDDTLARLVASDAGAKADKMRSEEFAE